jgi:hypothetical protein
MYQDFQIYQKTQPNAFFLRNSKERRTKNAPKEKLPSNIDYSIALFSVSSKEQPLSLNEKTLSKQDSPV